MTERQRLRKEMRNIKRLKLAKSLFLLACTFHLIGCGTFMLTYVAYEAKASAVFWPSNLVAALIWSGNLLGYLLLLLTHFLYKSLPPRENPGPIGLFSFFKTVPGTVADIVFLICAVVIVLMLTVFHKDDGYLLLTALSLGAFSLNMHGYLNGREFRYFFHYNNREEQ